MKKIKYKEEYYKEYCSKVDDTNRLKYNWWVWLMMKGWVSYEDAWNYTMQKNRPLTKLFEKYQSLCTDCEPFNRYWFRLYYSKKWLSMEQVLELTRSDKYIYRSHMTESKPKTQTRINREARDNGLLEKIRLKRIELGHIII